MRADNIINESDNGENENAIYQVNTGFGLAFTGWKLVKIFFAQPKNQGSRKIIMKSALKLCIYLSLTLYFEKK